jgi:hypothetical protein
MATDASVPNNFTVGTPAVADDVDANFDAITTWINTNAVHLDASKAFTAVPSGPATDPSSDNQLTRKAYVDSFFDSGTYTPTWTNVAFGSGGGADNTGNYQYVGGTLTAWGFAEFGTTGTTFPGTSITVSLPSGFEIVSSFPSAGQCGTCVLADVGTTNYYGVLRKESATTVRFITYTDVSTVHTGTVTTYIKTAGTGTAVPFTWVAGDQIFWHLSVPAVRV